MMRTITITGVSLARITIVLGYILVCALALGTTAALAFTGYILFSIGADKAAMFLWGAACLVLAGLGLLGSFLPSWLRMQA